MIKVCFLLPNVPCTPPSLDHQCCVFLPLQLMDMIRYEHKPL